MRRLIDIAFIFAFALVCLGLDFYSKQRASTAQSFGVSDYIARYRGDLDDLLNPPSLRAAIPSALDGWQIVRSGGEILVGSDPAERPEEVGEIALVREVGAVAKAASLAVQSATVAMIKGDTRLRIVVALQENAAPAEGVVPAALTASDAHLVLQTLLIQSDGQPDKPIFDVVDGVPFSELSADAATSDADIRLLRAVLTGALSVSVVTQSTDDGAIKEALQRHDFVMMNKLLATPVEGVTAGRMSDVFNGGAAAPLAALPANSVPQSDAAAKIEAVGTIQTPVADAVPQPVTATVKAPPSAQKAMPAKATLGQAPLPGAASQSGKACVRRAGVLICPEG